MSNEPSAIEEPPWADLDPLIVPLVRLLYEAGIPTISSCQGGRHSQYATDLATVTCAIEPEDQKTTRLKIAKIMAQSGWGGFSIIESHRHDYQGKGRPWRNYSKVTVEVWSLENQPSNEILA